MNKTPFGVTRDGRPVDRYTFTNGNGLTVSFLNYGGIVQELWVPDRDGNPGNVVLGHETLEGYLENPAYLGAVIGRTAGRLRDGVLRMGAETFPLERNQGGNCLHGGTLGFHQKWMAAECLETPEAFVLVLRFDSADGEGGYPGALALELRYSLLKRRNRLCLELTGISDRDTYLNMTHHSYFNLSGREASVAGQQLLLNADAYAPVNGEMLPEAGWEPVAGTPFDFGHSKLLLEGIHGSHPQQVLARGIDHPFRLVGDGAPCARLQDPGSGRTMTVSTDQPHLVIYTGNYLDDVRRAVGGTFLRHQGICFEAQEVPDAPGNPHFSCRWLEAGKTYRNTLRYDFGMDRG